MNYYLLKKIKTFSILVIVFSFAYVSSHRDLNFSNRNDTSVYNMYYQCLGDSSIFDCQKLIGAPINELTLGISMKTFNILGLSYSDYIAVVVFIFIASIFYFYQSTTKYEICVFCVFLLSPFFYESISNVLRQTLAISLFLIFSSLYLRCNNNKKTLLVLMFLTLFISHAIVILFFLCFLLCLLLNNLNKDVYIKSIVGILVFSISSVFYFRYIIDILPLGDVLKFKLIYYSSLGSSGLLSVMSQIGKVQIISYIVLLLIYFRFNTVLLDNNRLKLCFSLFCISLSIVFMFSFMDIAYRMLILPAILYPLLIICALVRKKTVALLSLVPYLYIQMYYFASNYTDVLRAFLS